MTFHLGHLFFPEKPKDRLVLLAFITIQKALEKSRAFYLAKYG
jgi:hypothetical protein